MEDFRTPVPATLHGARVLTEDEAADIWNKNGAVFIDVYPQAPKPPNLPAGTFWREPGHRSIEGAQWLPNVGYGALSATMDEYFRSRLERAVEGQARRAAVFFCLKDCWMSWNAAKRALEYGYTQRHVVPRRDRRLAGAGLSAGRREEAPVTQPRMSAGKPEDDNCPRRAVARGRPAPSALHLRADQAADLVHPLLDQRRDLAGHRQVLLALLEDAGVPVVLLLLGRQLGLGGQQLIGRGDAFLGQLLRLRARARQRGPSAASGTPRPSTSRTAGRC